MASWVSHSSPHTKQLQTTLWGNGWTCRQITAGRFNFIPDLYWPHQAKVLLKMATWERSLMALSRFIQLPPQSRSPARRTNSVFALIQRFLSNLWNYAIFAFVLGPKVWKLHSHLLATLLSCAGVRISTPSPRSTDAWRDIRCQNLHKWPELNSDLSQQLQPLLDMPLADFSPTL